MKVTGKFRSCMSFFELISILILYVRTESFAKFLGVEELMYFDEADIKQLGIRNSAHRARIVSSLVALRDKHHRGPGKLVCRLG